MARADGIGPPPPAAARATLVVGARELAAERERAASSAKAPPPKMLLAVFVAALAVVGRGTLPLAFSVCRFRKISTAMLVRRGVCAERAVPHRSSPRTNDG